MLNGKETLPRPLLEALADSERRVLVEAPGETVFDCPSLTSPGGKSLLLSLEDERTPSGRALVGALWFDRPLYVWLCGHGKTLRLTARVRRCHIVGPVFSLMLARVREKDPAGDIASAWELAVEDWSERDGPPPAPESQFSGLERELHLDNPRLRSD